MAGARAAPQPRWRRPGRTEGLTLLILGFALAAGVTGGLLLHVAGTPTPPTSTLGGLNARQASAWVVDALAVGILLVAVLGIVLIVRRIYQGTVDWTMTLSIIAAFLIVLSALVVFLLVSRLVVTNGIPALIPGGKPPANNSTSGGHGGGNATNVTGPSSGPSSGSGQSPSVVQLLAYLIPVVLVLGLLVVPLALVLLARLAPAPLRAEGEPDAASPAEVTRLLSEALDDLARGDTATARETILLAYSALLAMLRESGLRNLSSMTARDIEEQMRLSLGITAAGSSRLRQLFEEARYSPHDMTAAQAAEAKADLRQVLEEVNNLPTRVHARAPTVVEGSA